MDRRAWDQRLARYQALRTLFDADTTYGPLGIANQNEDAASAMAQSSVGEIRTNSEAQFAHWSERGEQELARHMATIYNPLIDATMALLRTPAPDIAAVMVKHEACATAIFPLNEEEEEEGEAFAILEADVRRLLGGEDSL